jgi:hypothetical protein
MEKRRSIAAPFPIFPFPFSIFLYLPPAPRVECGSLLPLSPSKIENRKWKSGDQSQRPSRFSIFAFRISLTCLRSRVWSAVACYRFRLRSLHRGTSIGAATADAHGRGKPRPYSKAGASSRTPNRRQADIIGGALSNFPFPIFHFRFSIFDFPLSTRGRMTADT